MKTFLQVAGSKDTPPANAFEAYCSVPFLYQSYSDGIVKLGKAQPQEVTAELAKIALPIGAKATELASECLKRASESEHDGPMFRRANDKWGWAANPALKKKTSRIVQLLEKSAPWLDPSPIKLSESEIIAQHLQSGATPDTWYALARQRLTSGRTGLARLTLIDALSKAPDSGRLLNALALIEQSQPDPKGIAGFYERAAKQGSPAAWVNLGLYHLKAERLASATGPLREALGSNVFDDNEELKNLVKEVAAP